MSDGPYEISGEIVLEIARAQQFVLPILDFRWCYYVDDPDAAVRVLGLRTDGPTLEVSTAGGTRRISMLAMARGYFITEQFATHEELNSLRSATNIRAEKARSYLTRKGAKVDRPEDELTLLARAFYKAERGVAGTRSERARIWGLVDREREARFVEALTTKWCDCVPGDELVPADLLIFRAAAARASGNIDVAIDCCRRAHLLRHRYKPSDLAVLATEGAAALLDKCEKTGAAGLVTEAESLLRFAWATSPNEHVSAVYNRLRRTQSFVSQVQNAETALQARNRLKNAENQLSHPNPKGRSDRS